MTAAVTVDGLGKRYQLGDRVHYGRMSEALIRMGGAPRRLLTKRGQEETGPKFSWALRDVTFDVEEGEVIGFVGANGAGKSTLLKLLSRITEPTEGRAVLRGRVGCLLEVGTGFHPELTGRENVFLSGAILGMRRAEIRRKYDEIIEFADIGDYVDTPVKRYSSGMQVRLGFAVAAHLESEILIVDEVLAVGDAEFQKRCLGKLEDMAHGGGRTVLFVSHNLRAVHGLCDRAVYLDGGRLMEIGDAPTVVRSYMERSATVLPEKSWADPERPGDEVLKLSAVRVLSTDGELLSATSASAPIIIELEVDLVGSSQVAIGLDLETEDGSVVLSSFLPNARETAAALTPGRNLLSATIPAGLLNSGRFTVGPRASRFGVGQIFHEAASVQFEVFSAQADSLFGLRQQGAIAPALDWRIKGNGL